MLQDRISLRQTWSGTQDDWASAEDRALRGRDLSADRSLANGRSGRLFGGPAKPLPVQEPNATNPSVHASGGSALTDQSPFESYTTKIQKNLVNQTVCQLVCRLIRPCLQPKTQRPA
jgi:hypothetical protein